MQAKNKKHIRNNEGMVTLDTCIIYYIIIYGHFLVCILCYNPNQETKVYVNVSEDCSTLQLICIWSCPYFHSSFCKLGPGVQKPK